ncbi:MAG: SDR family oxidoreductase [Acidobacteria bacterium]|nr:SDR family oxidoreductase [Acidobacteriota bacterium]
MPNDAIPAAAERATYLVVAASSAIGTALVRRLARRGAHIVMTTRRPEALEALAAEVDGRVAALDATSFGDLDQAAVDAAAWTGRLDGVVNCAGSIALKPAHLTSADDLAAVLAANLVTAFATVRAGASVMRQTGGSIVLISSAAASVGLPNHEAIAAAKAGVVGLMRAAAATYASYGIRVNAVAPGLVASPLSQLITASETALKASIAMHPLGRIGAPDDIARAADWLLGSESAWVTGQVLGVDGGLTTVRARARA